MNDVFTDLKKWFMLNVFTWSSFILTILFLLFHTIAFRFFDFNI